MSEQSIPLSNPDITQEEIDAVVEVLRSDRLSIGPRVTAFEEAVARRAGRRFGIGVNSGTSGLHLCVRALDLKDEDEVITTPFSFMASTNCLLFERAKPVFVDIDAGSYNMDPDAVEGAITPRTKAILPVEVFGNTAHFDAYERIARRNGLKMIEDCCEALGGKLGNRPAGSFGDCGVFGFYPNKQITSGEGGIIVTDDQRLDDLCRSMRNQGRRSGIPTVYDRIGYNYRLTELSAALGETQMHRLDAILESRRGAAHMYDKALADIGEIHLPPRDGVGHSWFVYVIRLADRFNATDREALLTYLMMHGVAGQCYFPSIHVQPYIRRMFDYDCGDFPVCEAVSDRTVALPFFTSISENQVGHVARALKEGIAALPSRSVTARVPDSAGATEAPSRHRPIPFFHLSCDGNELKYVDEVLKSGWLTTASKTGEFERRFAEVVGAQYASAVNSCTSALHLAVEALGVKPGDRVFVPTMTFTSSAEVVRYMGAEPLLLDVEYGTSLLTPQFVARAAREHPDVRVLVLVHFGGQPAQMLSRDGAAGILEVCERHNIRIVEDAAHAFPSRIGDRMVGSFGHVTCFSFYANKTITTGEGGMITTNDKALADRVNIMRLHGIDRSVWDRFSAIKAGWEYDVVAPGFKYNMPDINAAIGLAQLERADVLFNGRLRCAKFYLQALADIEHLDLPICHGPMDEHSWHLFVPVLKPSAPIRRNELIDRLNDLGIGTSVHYKPLHRMSYYRERYKLSPGQFPEAERIWQGCFSLPIYAGLSDHDLDYICTSLRRLLTR